MKNPRSHFLTAVLNQQTLIPRTQHSSSKIVLDPQQLAFLLENENKESDLTKVLKFLKFTPEEIARTTALVTVVGKIASTVNWTIVAVGTIKSILKWIGILEKDADPYKKTLDDIAEKVEAIYNHLLNDARRQLYVQKAGWRTKINGVTNSISNAASSRSQENINSLISTSLSLQQAIEEMLDIPLANIGFNKTSQNYVVTDPRSHWIDAAHPFYMEFSGGALTTDYIGGVELGKEIWDPGFYLDILFDAIALRISALSILEPAFRSTGHDHGDLLNLQKQLQLFLDKWSKSILITKVVGPIEPISWPHPNFDKQGSSATGHRLWNPTQYPAGSIVLGAADPATGLTALDFRYAAKFIFAPAPSPYPVLTNFEDAVITASTRRDLARQRVERLCGIARMRELLQHVKNLVCSSGSESEFVNFSASAIGVGALHWTNQSETLELGIIGQFAGHPGKKYNAERYHGYIYKKFSVSMARRMDVSGIQLGYRLEIDVGGPDGRQDIILTPYSVQNSTTQENKLPVFPTEPLQVTLRAASADIYDVVQSGLFSVNEEDEFENAGSVSGKKRLFINKRSGRAEIGISITFAFDESDPDQRFVGYANVEMFAPDNWPDSHGFICEIRVYEKRKVCVDPVMPDKGLTEREVMAETMKLHFFPSFLVVDEQYFEHWEEGKSNLDKAMREVNEDYTRKWEELGPPQPIELIERVAIEEKLLIDAFSELMRDAPETAKATLLQFAPRIGVTRHHPKTTVAEASRAHDLPLSETESWIEDGKKRMENTLRANPLDIREQYEKQIKELQEAYGEAMLELRAQKKMQPLLGEDEK